MNKHEIRKNQKWLSPNTSVKLETYGVNTTPTSINKTPNVDCLCAHLILNFLKFSSRTSQFPKHG